MAINNQYRCSHDSFKLDQVFRDIFTKCRLIGTDFVPAVFRGAAAGLSMPSTIMTSAGLCYKMYFLASALTG